MRFWVRRWMRTLPAYYTVLSVVYCWQVVTQINPIIDMQYLFFVQNYNFEHLPYFTVSWSLCVEEHFYLAIAPLLQMITLKRMRWLLLVLLFFPSFARYMQWYSTLAETQVRFDVCGAGVFLAYLRYDHRQTWSIISNFRWSYVAIVGIGLSIAMACRGFNVKLRIVESVEFWIVIFSLAILCACFFNTCSILDWIFHYIATRAYSLYLMHQFVLVIAVKRIGTDRPVLLIGFVILVSVLLSEVLYQLIEKPFMNLREHIKISKSRSVV